MTLATILLKLWKLRLWVGVGVVLALVAAAGSVATSHSTVYATASTQMLVDSPASALANAGADVTGYAARANVFARLMTSAEALQYIGQEAGIPGNLITANGPIETDGALPAVHAPTDIQGGKSMPAPVTYKLSFLQNPDLPTVDVYAEAPTTAKAIALANGAVTGFAKFISQLDGNNVPPAKRIEVRQLGGATGGIVDATASKKVAVLIFVAVLAIWCGIVLFVSRLRAQLRAAKKGGADDLFAVPEELTPALFPDDQLAPARAAAIGNSRPLGDQSTRFPSAADARLRASDASPFHRALGNVGRAHQSTPDTWDDPKGQRVGSPRQEGVREAGLRP